MSSEAQHSRGGVTVFTFGPYFMLTLTVVAGVLSTTGRKLDRENQPEHILEVSNLHKSTQPPLENSFGKNPVFSDNFVITTNVLVKIGLTSNTYISKSVNFSYKI